MPLPLSAEETTMLLTLAAPIDKSRQPEFLGAVTTKLEAAGPAAIGPGAVHRVRREILGRFLDPAAGSCVKAGWGLEGLGANLRHFRDSAWSFPSTSRNATSRNAALLATASTSRTIRCPSSLSSSSAFAAERQEASGFMSRGQSRKKLLAGSFSFSASMNAVCSGQQKPSGSQR